MPPEAKVLIAEDEPYILKDIMEALAEAGHQVVATGMTLAEAEAMVSQIPEFVEKYGEDKIVFVLGGNLEGWRLPNDPYNDSQVLLRLLGKNGLGHIKTVGFSGNYVPGAMVNVCKAEGRRVLVEAVSAI